MYELAFVHTAFQSLEAGVDTLLEQDDDQQWLGQYLQAYQFPFSVKFVPYSPFTSKTQPKVAGWRLNEDMEEIGSLKEWWDIICRRSRHPP